MTNLEAIKAKVQYPLSDDMFSLALFERGLTPAGEYVLINKKQMDLAEADCIVAMVTSPASVSEGGYSISKSDVESLRKLASSLYRKWGLVDPFVSSISNATNRW